MDTSNLSDENELERQFEEMPTTENNFEREGEKEKEKIVRELEKIDAVRKIMEERYHYGVLKDFVNHLASTEKVFVLAGIKKFGGDEIMNLFIQSETEVMSDDTGIDEDVFSQIKEEFSKTCKTVGDIKNVSDKLMQKYPEAEKFIEYITNYLIVLLQTSGSINGGDFDIDKKRDETIHEMMVKIAENDSAEIEELEKIYKEFKEELNN